MIAAIILAAGESKRMGQPKMLLPWGDRTVIGHVISTFLQAGIQDVLVVTGGAHEQIEKAIEQYPIRKILNRDYTTGEMLSSLQCGLRKMRDNAQAALIGLGDQPQVQVSSIRAICNTYRAGSSSLIVPSYNKRRGHPWLVARPLWDEILALQFPNTPRDFLQGHSDQIQYVSLDTPTVLADIDTPEDYQKSRP